MVKVSIIIPVHNEASTIREIIERVRAIDFGHVQKEVIISNDGSTDETATVITQLEEIYPDIICYTSPTNFGKGAAVRAGITIATGDIIAIQDADLELDPSEIPLLIQPLLDGHSDIVYGSRFLKFQSHIPARTKMANRFLTLLTNILYGSRLSDMETAYKVFKREIINDIRLRCVRFDFEPEITARFLQKGHNILEVPITYNPRTEGQGKKISWIDGLDAIYTLLRCRFFK